mmetsp:Transcript_47996/g.96804  ORF Transcript_47996/g.96804 Transcript_47996/m.96804 type:complete len:293 (-) Transcript_47996:335-1213(-)
MHVLGRVVVGAVPCGDHTQGPTLRVQLRQSAEEEAIANAQRGQQVPVAPDHLDGATQSIYQVLRRRPWVAREALHEHCQSVVVSSCRQNIIQELVVYGLRVYVHLLQQRLDRPLRGELVEAPPRDRLLGEHCVQQGEHQPAPGLFKAVRAIRVEDQLVVHTRRAVEQQEASHPAEGLHRRPRAGFACHPHGDDAPDAVAAQHPRLLPTPERPAEVGHLRFPQLQAVSPVSWLRGSAEAEQVQGVHAVPLRGEGRAGLAVAEAAQPKAVYEQHWPALRRACDVVVHIFTFPSP